MKQIPTLQVDERIICQSTAIYRYLASEFGLYGSSNLDKATADQVGETIEELLREIKKIFTSPESQEKKVWTCLAIKFKNHSFLNKYW